MWSGLALLLCPGALMSNSHHCALSLTHRCLSLLRVDVTHTAGSEPTKSLRRASPQKGVATHQNQLAAHQNQLSTDPQHARSRERHPGTLENSSSESLECKESDFRPRSSPLKSPPNHQGHPQVSTGCINKDSDTAGGFLTHPLIRKFHL